MTVEVDSADHILVEYDGGQEVAYFHLRDMDAPVRLAFQNGTIPDVGANGVTNEAVIVALVLRLRDLNAKFPCRENSLAITKLEEGLHWLYARTLRRRNQGIEGQHVEKEQA